MTADLPAGLWASLGLSPLHELHAGHQSRVFRAVGRGGDIVVKVVDVAEAGRSFLHRVELVARLAEIHPAAVGPIAVGSDLVTETEGRLVVCYPFVEGSAPQADNPAVAAEMGTALAQLHAALAEFPTAERRPETPRPSLPPVPALRRGAPERMLGDQLIHGDFGPSNLISTEDGLRIIDFDDCGRGTIEFELGNTLYMTWFDAWNADDHDRYERFRKPFREAYRRAATIPVHDPLVAVAATTRLDALDRWLADPADAPIGIRTASRAWRAKLRAFVDYTKTQRVLDGRAPEIT